MLLSYVASFSQAAHRRNAVDNARLAEAAGYHSVWVPEAFGSDAMTLLGLIAGHTSRLGLASGIVNVFSRTPALLAQSFATLDEMSEGRAIIGLGVSGPVVVEQWHGLPFDKPLTRLRETVEIVRLALNGERVNYDGATFKLKGFQLQIRPVQRRIPIYLATFRPNAVRLTGAIADGWLPTHVSLRHVDALRANLIAGATTAGRNPAEIDMAAMTLAACSADGEMARALCREHLAYYVGGMGTFYHELLHSYGYGATADSIKAYWAKRDRAGAARAIPREVLDDLVIAGTQAECRAAIEARSQAGFGHIVAFPPHGSSPEQVRENAHSAGALSVTSGLRQPHNGGGVGRQPLANPQPLG